MTTASAPRELRLAVSTVIFALRRGDDDDRPGIWLPLVRRLREPYDGLWALPGGPLGDDEDLDEAAARTLAATTSLTPRYLEQLYAFGDRDRSGTPPAPASSAHDRVDTTAGQDEAEIEVPPRVVSIVYWALAGSREAAHVSEGQNVRWFAADRLPALAFDHNRIVDYALWRLRNKVEYSSIALALLGETFTMAQLREVHEAVLGRRLDPANFRRSVESAGGLVDTGRRVEGTRHRPPRLYRYEGAVDPADSGPLRRPVPRRIRSVGRSPEKEGTA